MSAVATHTRSTAGDALRFLGVASILVVGGVHLQQYKSFISDVPTIGTLFLLNAIGAAGIALGITALRGKLAAMAAASGVGLSLGALGSIVIAMNGTIFGYAEPSFRPGVTIAVIAEIVSVVVLSALAMREFRSDET
ncbi:hypothetical protein BH10ACT11_BH10ACT11_00550 [soil metagenome]